MSHRLTISLDPNQEAYQVLYVETETKISHWGPKQTREIRRVVLFSDPNEEECNFVLRDILENKWIGPFEENRENKPHLGEDDSDGRGDWEYEVQKQKRMEEEL